MRRLLHSILLAFVVLAPGACKSKVGDTCSGAAEACADEHTKLACRHDRFMPVQCDGPKGCKVDGEKARCDYSGNKLGVPCDSSVVGKRMCRDAKSAIGCLDGKMAVTSCAGPGGCTATGPEADAPVKDCDTTVAKEGDDCDRAFTIKPACDVDTKKLLECGRDNKWAFFRYCRGPKGCTSVKGEASCDGSVQQIGDPCSPPGEWCSDDGVAVLLCDGSKIFEKICPGPKGCTKADNGVSCDGVAPIENSPCDKKGQQACQKAYEKDPEKLLECDGSKFKVAKRCLASCKIKRPGLNFECK